MNQKVFIQIVIDKNNSKIKITLPIIIEFNDLDFEYLKQNLKHKYNQVITEEESKIIFKENQLEVLVWKPNISKTKSNITKSKEALKVDGLNNFDLILIEQIKTFFNNDQIRNIVNIVNQIIAWNQNNAKIINFWTIHMSVINWVYFVTYTFNLDFLTNPQWKQIAFKIKTNENDASMQANFLIQYGFVDFIVISKTKNMNSTKALFSEILREALLLQDEKENRLLKLIYDHYEYSQKLDRDKKYLVIYAK